MEHVPYAQRHQHTLHHHVLRLIISYLPTLVQLLCYLLVVNVQTGPCMSSIPTTDEVASIDRLEKKKVLIDVQYVLDLQTALIQKVSFSFYVGHET